MALPTNANQNLYKGKGVCYFTPDGQTGKLDLGEVSVFSNTPEITKTPFYSNRSGTKLKLFDTVDEKTLTGGMTCMEGMQKDIAALGLFAGTPTAGTQSAGTLDAVETTTVENRFVSLGKMYNFYYKFTHGTAAGGSPANGDTVTGVTSSATADLVYAGSGYIEVVNVSGTFVAGETIGNGTWTAVLNVPLKVSGAIVCDDASGTTRYTKGTDYDENSNAGYLRENSDGSIAANTCFVSCDYAALVTNQLNVLASDIVQGQLEFIGDNDQGNRVHVWYPKATLSADGDLSLISEDNLEFGLAVEILSDADTYPDYPFGYWLFVEEA